MNPFKVVVTPFLLGDSPMLDRREFVKRGTVAAALFGLPLARAEEAFGQVFDVGGAGLFLAEHPVTLLPDRPQLAVDEVARDPDPSERPAAELHGGLELLRHAMEPVPIAALIAVYPLRQEHLSPAIEEKAMSALGLRAAPASTQIVQRDRHAEYFGALALAGASIEKFAVEIRHLQRTEVREVEEAFGKGQKGSSAMPHKRNPILSENLSGLARVLRGYALSALEDVPLWHERDISHSSVERVIGPDATVTLDFMLHRFAGLMDGLRVYPERMRQNLELTRGLVFSQPVLLQLIAKGMERQAAYAVVQRNAMKVWEEDRDFRELLAADPDVKKLLKSKELSDCFDLDRQLRHVDTIFSRILTRP